MKPKQQWLRGWMREKVRAGEIPGWVFDCLDGEIPGEIPAPDRFHDWGWGSINMWWGRGSGSVVMHWGDCGDSVSIWAYLKLGLAPTTATSSPDKLSDTFAFFVETAEQEREAA